MTWSHYCEVLRFDEGKYKYYIELADNIFRIAQTEAKLKIDKVDNEYTANSVHFEIGTIVRNAIKEAGGAMPEDLPTPEKSLKEIERKKDLLKNTKE